jgi:hypothetical protein
LNNTCELFRTIVASCRRPEDGDGSGDVQVKTLLVSLDGSEVAEKVLPTVYEIKAKGENSSNE